MSYISNFYVKNNAGGTVAATYLVLPGQLRPVADPNAGTFIPTSPTNPALARPTLWGDIDGTVPLDDSNQNPNNYLIVPVSFNINNSIAFAQELDSEGVTATPVDNAHLGYMWSQAVSLMETPFSASVQNYITASVAGGSQDLQRAYQPYSQGTDPFVKAFIDAASYNYGLIGYLAGLPLDGILGLAGFYNLLNGGKSLAKDRWGNSQVDSNSITAGYNAGHLVGTPGTLPSGPFSYSSLTQTLTISYSDGTSIQYGLGTDSNIATYYNASNVELSSVQLNHDGSEIDTVFNTNGGDLASTTKYYSASNNLTNITESSLTSATLTVAAKTDSGLSYDGSGNTVTDALTTAGGGELATLAFNTATSADSVSFADGLSVALGGITTDTIAAVSSSTSPLATLVDYLSDLADSTSASALDALNTAFLYASGLPSQGTTLDLNSHSGVVNQAEFNALTNISGTGVITAAASGTYDLAVKNVTGDVAYLTATDWLGTTLIGNNQDDQKLTASLYGDDDLYAGSGTGDQLVAGLGQDLLVGGKNGGGTFLGYGTSFTLADGSHVEGQDTGNKIQVDGDISGSTVTGMQTLDTNDISLTALQFAQFDTVLGLSSTITLNAVTGGTYDLSAVTDGTLSVDMTALSNDGTTLITNPNGDAQTLTASATGNDTLEAGNIDDTLVAGGGVDTLIGGNTTTFMATNGLAAGSIVDGNDDFNTLYTSGDISGVLVSGVNELITNNITLTALQFSGFDSISGGSVDGGTINASGGGTFDLDTEDTNTAEQFNMNAVSNSGTTLIGNDADGEILTASAFGTDTLTAGNGSGDTLIAGGGTDTLTAGSGDDTLVAGTGVDTINGGEIIETPHGLAAGSVINGDGGLLEASGDISGATITGISELKLEGNVILTSAQYAGFFSVDSSDGTYTILGSSDTAASTAALAGTTGNNPVFVVDTAANVASHITDLETVALAGGIVSTSFTDSGTPALSFSASDAASYIDAIATFTGTFTLAVSDTAANVATNIDALGELAAIGDLTSIALTDGGTPTLDLTATQVGDDAGALALITSAYTVAVSDIGDNVAANLDALQALATSSLLSSITLTDSSTPTLSITETQLSDDSGALAFIGSTYDLAISDVLAADAATIAAETGVTSVSVADTAANVQSNLSALETLAAADTLTSIFFTDSSLPTLEVTETQLTSDAGALALIAGSYDLTVTSVAAADAATVAATAGVTTVSISDTAANVVANLSELQTLAAAGELGTITLTDSGTPTLSLSQVQLTADADALASITGSYDISPSSVLAGSAATVAAETGVTSVSVEDTAANVAANLDALETLAGDSELTSITLVDPGTPVLTITATQLSSDSTALGLIGGSYDLAVTGVSAANAATVAAESHVTSVSVSDTAANVASNIDSLQTVASSLAAITLTDGGTPTLTITGTQFSGDTGALSAITSAYHLTVTGVLAANVATVAANSHVTSITVSDTAANVASNIDALESAASKLATFSLTDSGTPSMTISYTQLINDATALGKISGTFDITVSGTLAANAATAATKAHVTSILVSDTAAHVTTSLSALETLATAGTLTSVSFTDSGTPTLTLTYTQFSGDTALLSTFTGSYILAVTSVLATNAATVAANTHVTSISVSDTSANIATNINALESVAGVLTSITASDGGSQTITITAAQASNDYGAVSQLTGSYKIGVTDTAANISANIDALQTLSTFAPTGKMVITASDGATNNIVITAAQAGSDSGAIGRSSGSFHVEVTDTAANIAADFLALQNLVTVSKLTSVVFTDSGTPIFALTYAQFSSGTGTTILSDISSSYHLTVSAVPYADISNVFANTHATSITVSDTAATISTNLNTLQTSYAATGKLTGVTVTNGSTTAVSFTYAQLSSDATLLGLFTGTYSFKVSAVPIANAATVLAMTNVLSINISDTAANVMSNLSTLETYANASQVSGILLTDGTTPAMTATATQGASYSAAFGLITSAFHLTINDTAANVQANLDGLQALYGAVNVTSDLAAITLTDGGTPTLTISAAQATTDANAIGKITSAYHLTVSDTAANVVANLTGLETLGTKLTTIVLTDGGTPNLAITGAQFGADITAINKITSAYTMTVSSASASQASAVAANTHVSSFTVSDTATNIGTQFASLQTQTAGGKLTAITIASGALTTITYSQYTSGSATLALITNTSYNLSVSGVSIANSSTMLAEPNVVSVNISDTAANVQSNIDSLETLDAAGEITGIVLTDGGTPTITITAAQATSDKTAILDITSSHNLVVNDTSANVLADMAGLIALGAHLTTITLTDGGTPNFAITGSEYNADSTTLSKITSAYTLTVSAASASQGNTVGANTHVTSYAIVDSVSSVAADLGLIEPHTSTLSSITLTDSGTPTLSITGTVLNSDAAAIAKIATTYDETVKADANTTETLAGTGSVNTVTFASEAQGVTANLSTGTATTVHAGTTNTYTLSNFMNLTGSTLADTLTAGTSGGILTGDGGADTYVLNASSGFDIAQDTATHLNGTTIQNFSVLDGIDLTNITNSGSTTLGFLENGAGTQGTLTVSDGTHTAALTLLGNYTTSSFQDVSDGASGTLVAMASTTHLSAILAAAQA